jgi:hypothetical protein
VIVGGISYTGAEKQKIHTLRLRLQWSAKQKNVFPSLLKFRVILTVLTLLNPNMTTKLPYHPPVLREEGLYSKI